MREKSGTAEECKLDSNAKVPFDLSQAYEAIYLGTSLDVTCSLPPLFKCDGRTLECNKFGIPQERVKPVGICIVFARGTDMCIAISKYGSLLKSRLMWQVRKTSNGSQSFAAVTNITSRRCM